MQRATSAAAGIEAMRAGGWMGAGAGCFSAIGILDGNRALLDPRSTPLSAVIVVLALAVAGAACGGAAGIAGARLAQRLGRRADDAGRFTGLLAGGILTLPAWAALAAGVALVAARWGRRRRLPRRSRLDALFALASLAGCAAAASLSHTPRIASVWLTPEPGGAPAVGSIPVTITVHREPGFPETPAIHLSTRALLADSLGRSAALWSGAAPARTPAGAGAPRRVPGGGIIAWTPPFALPRLVVPCISRAIEGNDRELARRPLEDIVRSAGIPILRAPPQPDDPPLWLRVLESDAPPEGDLAKELTQSGAWIDVSLAPQERIALGGEGVLLAPPSTTVSLVDVTPTALHLLGLAVPRDSDGRVLIEALDPTGPGARAPRYRTRANRSSSTRP